MKNEIKKRKEVVSPKCLKPKKDHEIRAPKPMKEKKEKKKRSRSENGRRTNVKELSQDPQRLPKARDPRGI